MARDTEAPLTPAEGERIADEATREAQRKGVQTTGATLETIAPVAPVPVPGVEVTAERTTLYDLARQLMGGQAPAEALAQSGTIAERRASRFERAAADERRQLTTVQETAKAQERERAAAKPAPLTLPGAPSTAARPFLSPGESVLSQIQTAIQAVGLVGMGIAGLKGKGHAIAAVSALKGAAEGWAAGDAERVQRNLTEWNAHTKKLLAEHQAAQEGFNNTITDQKMTMDQMLSSLQITASIAGHEDLADAARERRLGDVIKWGENQQAHGEYLLGVYKSLKQYEDAERGRQERHADLEKHRRVTEAQAKENYELRKVQGAATLRLQGEVLGLGEKLRNMDVLEAAIGRLHDKKMLTGGPTLKNEWQAAWTRGTAFDDEQAGADIQTVIKLGTAQIVGSEIALGLSPSVARLSSVGTPEAAGILSQLPYKFWQQWFSRQRAAYKRRQDAFTDDLRRISPALIPQGAAPHAVIDESEE